MNVNLVRIGLIGTGGMAKWHAKRFKEIKGARLTACCDIVPGRAEEFARKHGIPAAYTSLEEMLDREPLDGVSVVTPDHAHAGAALAAIRRGLHVMCEKPLADNLQDAKKMYRAARKAGVLTAVNFSYRNAPATQRAAELVAQGRVGRVLHVEGCYLQSWLVGKYWGDWRQAEGFLWRLSVRHGSLGVLGDIGVHLYDLVDFVVGPFGVLNCDLPVFKKDPPRVGRYVFDANDSMLTTVRFCNGAHGVLHASRWATGHANTVALRVYGDRGALDLNLDRPAEGALRMCAGRDVDACRWQSVACLPVPDTYQRFVTSIRTGRQGQTSFEGAVRIQAYLECSMAAARKGGWVPVRA